MHELKEGEAVLSEKLIQMLSGNEYFESHVVQNWKTVEFRFIPGTQSQRSIEKYNLILFKREYSLDEYVEVDKVSHSTTKNRVISSTMVVVGARKPGLL